MRHDDEHSHSYYLHLEARRWRSRQLAMALGWLADSVIDLTARAFDALRTEPGNGRRAGQYSGTRDRGALRS